MNALFITVVCSLKTGVFFLTCFVFFKGISLDKTPFGANKL